MPSSLSSPQGAHPAHELQGIAAAAANEWLVEGCKDRARATAELEVPGCLSAARQGANRLGRALLVGIQVELASARPGVTCQHFRRMQPGQAVGGHSGGLEQLVEHPPHGEHRRAGVDGPPANADLAHLSAGRGQRFEHGHLDALRREADGAGEPADAGAHHDCWFGSHKFDCSRREFWRLC